MKSIRDCNTSGLELYEREKLYNEVIPIELNSVVYESGGFCDNVKEITVTSKNQKIVTMFWNSMYFDNHNDAQKATNIAHRGYWEWQWECAHT